MSATTMVEAGVYRHGPFDIPSVLVQTAMKRLYLYTELCGPVNQQHGLTVKRDEYSIATVARLLRLSGPAAVLRRVRAVVVDPVYRVFRGWFAAHVRQERREVIAPSVTHADTAPSIGRVGVVGHPVATRNYFAPHVVFTGPTPAVSPACDSGAFSGSLALKASTTFDISVSQDSGRCNVKRTAFAPAEKVGVPTLNAHGRVSAAEHGQSGEHATRQIDRTPPTFHRLNSITATVELRET